MPHHRQRATQAVVITWAAGYGAVVLGRRLVVEFFTHGVSQLGLALCVIQPSRRPLEWVHRSMPQASQRCALDQRRNLAQRGLLEWGSLEQNFIFGIVYYLVAVPGFTIGGFLFTRLPKTPRRRKTPGLKRSLH